MLTAYQTERTGIDYRLLLDANEHYTQWVKIDLACLEKLNRYPDNSALQLRESLAQKYCAGFCADNILVTSGSIEAIDLIVRSLRPESLVVNTPGYDVYIQQASIYGVPVRCVPLLPDGQVDTETIIAGSGKRCMVVLIHPNNPTGTLVSREAVIQLLENIDGQVVIDEAYIEYLGLEHSFEDIVKKYPNIIILRTFSKAWGLAGLRLGYLITTPELQARLTMFKNAYSVNSVALSAGLSALNQIDELKRQVTTSLQYKQELYKRMKAMGIPVTDSHANFLLIESADVLRLHQRLREHGIAVRPRKLIDAATDCLRLTVASQDQNEIFLSALAQVWHE